MRQEARVFIHESKFTDMKDLPLYEVVLEKQDDYAYLVTGNMKHFPKKPFIVTANEFLLILDTMLSSK